VIELPAGALAPGDVTVGDVLALRPAIASEVEVPLMARVS